jgi:hypothetical protein
MRMPAHIESIRRDCCAQAHCLHTPDFADPCAACPDGHWGPWMRCETEEPPLPSLPQMALNYAAAQGRDILAGRPRRTPEECAEIVRVHCEGEGTPCPHFRLTDRRCSACGCPVAEKIPMAREHCPMGKW